MSALSNSKLAAETYTEPGCDVSELPLGWAVATLQEIGIWRSGGTPSRTNPAYFGQGIPWVKSGDLPDGPITQTDEQITQLGLDNSAAKLMPLGTICMALYGATIGKLGTMTFEAATNQATANLIPDKRIVDGQYVFHYLMSERQNFIDLGQGGAQPNISQEIVRKHPIKVAPLAEQRRIVEKLELLLGKVSSSQQRLSRVPGLLKRFRQSVLAAACSGKLTADWREENSNVESAEITVRRFGASTSVQRTRRGVPEVVAVTDIVDAWDIPETWAIRSAAELLRIGAFVDLKDGNHGANHPRVSDFTESGLAFITAAQVNGFKIDYDGAYKLSGIPLSRLRVGFAKSGDVIYTHKGSVGRVALADRDCILTPQTTYYRVAAELFDKMFVMYFLSSPAIVEQVAGVKEQTTRDFVPISEQYLLFHRIPPLPEQQEIARRVEELFAVADQIESRLQQAQSHVDRLTQSILAKAFRGELVPTEHALAEQGGREYEPASVLLERLRQVAATETPAPRRKKART